MPLYDYECSKCDNVQEEFFKVKDKPLWVRCKKCGNMAAPVIMVGHGGIFREEPVWLDDGVRTALQDTDRVALGLEKPIETRSEYKRYLKENGISPKEG
jgi:putative FmdB family regulatory protein